VGGVAQVIAPLPSQHEALSSNPVLNKQKEHECSKDRGTKRIPTGHM
jgi:hypothetical protein